MESDDITIPPTESEVASLLLAIPSGGETAALHLTVRRLAYQRDHLQAKIFTLKKKMTGTCVEPSCENTTTARLARYCMEHR